MNSKEPNPYKDKTFENDPQTRILNLLQKLKNQQLRQVVLAIDEYGLFDQLISQGRLEPEFLDFLYHLQNANECPGLLFCGLVPFDQVGKAAHNWSIFKDVAYNFKIEDYLSRAAAEHLISKPVPDFPLTYEPKLIDAICTLTKRQPLLIQHLCGQLTGDWSFRVKKGEISGDDTMIRLDRLQALNFDIDQAIENTSIEYFG